MTPFVLAKIGDYAPEVMRKCEEAGAMEEGKYRVQIAEIEDEPSLYSASLLVSCLGTVK